MKKNNGFTLIELIVVIVIISIIFILTIPQIQKTSINSKIKLCQNKLSLIEDSLNLFLSTNQECYDDEDSSCYICTETKNGKCITNVERLAELGLVERDNENDVINPINKTKINDYKIAIDYNYNLEKFTSNFLSKEDENVYNTSIVLMTDGASNVNRLNRLSSEYKTIGKDIPIFSIMFGTDSETQLKDIASLTNAKIFDGKTNLLEAFKQVRGYN